MLDSDLAKLYEVETKSLNRQVRRNISRFPEDFMFQLTREEYESLKCQIGISKEGRGGKQKHPLVFTELFAVANIFVHPFFRKHLLTDPWPNQMVNDLAVLELAEKNTSL